MKTYAQVKDGIVQNIIVAADDFIAQQGAVIAPGCEWFDVSDDALAGAQRPGPGDELKGRGVKFVPPEPAQDVPGL